MCAWLLYSGSWWRGVIKNSWSFSSAEFSFTAVREWKRGGQCCDTSYICLILTQLPRRAKPDPKLPESFLTGGKSQREKQWCLNVNSWNKEGNTCLSKSSSAFFCSSCKMSTFLSSPKEAILQNILLIKLLLSTAAHLLSFSFLSFSVPLSSIVLIFWLLASCGFGFGFAEIWVNLNSTAFCFSSIPLFCLYLPIVSGQCHPIDVFLEFWLNPWP